MKVTVQEREEKFAGRGHSIATFHSKLLNQGADRVIDFSHCRPFVTARRLISMILMNVTISAHAANCDAGLGEQVFAKCTACHSLQAGQHMTGPSLHGLRGRRAGTVEGFSFSPALRDSGIVWGEATLDSFLQSPQTFIPGTVMPFGGIKSATDRAALVCYLLG
jgi:cytochrome c